MDLVRFLIHDLRGFEYYVCDERNGSYFGPHHNLGISDNMFHFATQSPTLPRIRDMLSTQHIDFEEIVIHD